MPDSRRLEKEKLRKLFLSIRKEIPAVIRCSKSAVITRQLFLFDSFTAAKRIFCYLSLPDEVQTDKIIDEALKKGKKVFVPVITGNQILPAQLKNLREVERGPLGIRQPVCPHLQTNRISFDLIITPGIVFDRQLFRLGFGKGYFDRFLSDYKGKTLLVGIAFKEQVINRLPIEPWDVQLDKVLTDEGWLKG